MVVLTRGINELSAKLHVISDFAMNNEYYLH